MGKPIIVNESSLYRCSGCDRQTPTDSDESEQWYQDDLYNEVYCPDCLEDADDDEIEHGQLELIGRKFRR